jgi:hypothetical protein
MLRYRLACFVPPLPEQREGALRLDAQTERKLAALDALDGKRPTRK